MSGDVVKRPPEVNRQINALRAIRDDMEADAAALDGALFNPKTVGVALGRIMAAVDALAGIMLSDLEAEPQESRVNPIIAELIDKGVLKTVAPEQPPINHFCYWPLSHDQPCREESCEAVSRTKFKESND